GLGTVLGIIQNFGADGALHWYRDGAIRREALDSDPNVTWQGRFYSLGSLTVTADSLYVTGVYENSYEPNSDARPFVRAAFVGRYDLDGEQIWFQELVLDEDLATDIPYPPVIAGLVERR